MNPALTSDNNMRNVAAVTLNCASPEAEHTSTSALPATGAYGKRAAHGPAGLAPLPRATDAFLVLGVSGPPIRLRSISTRYTVNIND